MLQVRHNYSHIYSFYNMAGHFPSLSSSQYTITLHCFLVI